MKIRNFIGYDLVDQVKLIVSKYLGRLLLRVYLKNSLIL